MPKRKNEHFAEMKGFSCVFEPENEVMLSGKHELKGCWHRDYFQNQNPITLELGCGKGEYTIALARKYPNQNFIGIDIKGARLWRGSKYADEENLRNVAFIRTRIEFLESFFAAKEIENIWLTFIDPQLKDKKGTKRMSSRYFLKRFARIMKGCGLIHLKTDSDFLYDRTIETIEEGNHHILKNTTDLYANIEEYFLPEEQEILRVKTFYEQKFLARNDSINYIQFQLNDCFYQAQQEE